MLSGRPQLTERHKMAEKGYVDGCLKSGKSVEETNILLRFRIDEL